MRLVRPPMRKMTSGTSETPSAQAGQGFRDFGFPGSNARAVRLATADVTEMASDFHRKTAKPETQQGFGGGAGSRSRTGTPSLAADFEFFNLSGNYGKTVELKIPKLPPKTPENISIPDTKARKSLIRQAFPGISPSGNIF